mmetsp:Transcript_114897/g.161421  ORF Transcript_114897/g.161421 Transcript_114897/m.161421 type:complete len:418 (-) Transcript_114897:303-1556(-)
MGFHEARPVCIVQVFLEVLQQEVELCSEIQKCPILVQELCEQRHGVTKVHHILDSKDIEVIEVHFHRSGILRELLFQSLGCIFIACFHQLLLLLLHGLLGCLQLLRCEGFALRRLLVVGLPPPPLLDRLLPLRPRLLEAGTRLQVLGSLRQLLLQDPLLEQGRAVGLSLPCEADGLEALLFARKAELRERLGQLTLRDVRGCRGPVGQGFLLLCEFYLDGLLHLHILSGLLRLRLCVVSVFLLALLLLLSCLLGLLCLLRLLALQLQHPLPLLGLGLALLLLLGLGLLLCQDEGLHFALVLCCGFAHDHHGLSREVLGIEPAQSSRSVGRHQVAFQFTDDVIAVQGGRDVGQNSTHAPIIQCRDTEVAFGLVQGPTPLWLPQATLLCPLQDLSITQLHIARVLFNELVHPIKETLRG